MMKKLLLLLLLSFFSTQSLAKVGDVYYCEMKQFVIMMPDRLVEPGNRVGERFKFKREKDKLLIRDSKWFGNMTMIVSSQYGDESFRANPEFVNIIDDSSVISYLDGDFGYSWVMGGFIRSFLAECEIW